MSRTIIRSSKLVIDQAVSAPIIFTFKDENDAVEGTVEVYKRSLTWYPRKGVKGYTLSVDRLAKVFEENGRKKRKRK